MEVFIKHDLIYRKGRNFCYEFNLHGQTTPTKIKPMKICTDKGLVTAITAGNSHPRKIFPRKFNPQNIVPTNISTFTVCVYGQ